MLKGSACGITRVPDDLQVFALGPVIRWYVTQLGDFRAKVPEGLLA